MASKAFPALLLLALVCGELATGGHAQALIGGPAGVRRPLPYARGGSPAGNGMQPPPYTTQPTTPEYNGAARRPGVEEEKAFMMPSLPARERPVPVPPTSN